MRVYATAADYDRDAEEPWSGEERVLTARLRAASIEVDKLTRLSRYEVDEDGYPTDPDISEAFSDATIAVVEYWQETDDPTGAEVFAGAVKIGSVSLGTTSSSSDSLSAMEKLQRRIGTRCIDILTNAGLITTFVAHT